MQMCGIIGYNGEKNAVKIVVNGLKSLEYRGYDSWGIAALKDNKLFVVKETGKIGGVSDESLELPESNISIGHTRWATHGKVNEINAHPHVSPDGRIAVVHNGIIENYQELREFLVHKGYRLESQTDTETIPCLIQHYMEKGNAFEDSVKKALSKIDGSFAIAALCSDSDKMVVSRRGSPIVIGVGKGEYFVSSDISAFIEHTQEVIFVEDNEMIVINNALEAVNIETGKKITKNVSRISWTKDYADKKDYEHFMLKEIYEQPDAIRATMDEAEKFEMPEELKNPARILIGACGTSWHAALIGEYMIESLAKIPVEVEYASEFRYRDPIIEPNTLFIAISQSGETADTLAAVKEAKSKGAKILSVCNVIGSTITRESDAVIYTKAGIEIGVASTKAFTCQLAVLFRVAVYLAEEKGLLDRKEAESLLLEMQSIPKKIHSILNNTKNILKCAEEHYKKKNALYLGRGPNYPIAMEGALKLKEVSYLHAEGYPAAEMKHGPIALVDNKMPSVVIAVKDKTYSKITGNIEEIKARGGIVIAVATQNDDGIKEKADNVIYVPETIDLLTPFLTVIPMQLLAYHIANKRGCDIDKPKNLAKSVTVE